MPPQELLTVDPPLLGFSCCICKSVKSSNGGWFAAALAPGKESMTFKKIGSDVAVDMNKKINTKVDVREGVAGEALHCYKCGKKEQVARRGMKRTVDEALFSFDFNLGDTNSLVAHTPALHPVPLPASSVATLAGSPATSTVVVAQQLNAAQASRRSRAPSTSSQLWDFSPQPSSQLLSQQPPSQQLQTSRTLDWHAAVESPAPSKRPVTRSEPPRKKPRPDDENERATNELWADLKSTALRALVDTKAELGKANEKAIVQERFIESQNSAITRSNKMWDALRARSKQALTNFADAVPGVSVDKLAQLAYRLAARI